MAFIPLVGGVKAVIHGLWNGQNTQNILYFQTDNLADPSQSDVIVLCSLLNDWYSSDILPNLNESFTYLNVECTAINVAFGFQVTNGTATGVGGVTGESMPGNVDPCISFRGNTSGRFARGRNYVPGISASDVAGNVLDADWMTSIAAGYEALTGAGAFDPDPFNWVVASFFFNGAPRVSGLATEVFFAGFTDNIVDSQRRRLPGRGR